MVILSTLRSLLRYPSSSTKNAVVQRFMSDHRTFPLQPTRWQWTKFKDVLHFYVMLGVIPCSLVVLYTNVFIGPATLSEIPEGYTPKHWEYYKHPITRFIARYLLSSPQQDYEKYLAYLYEEEEKTRLRKLERQIKKRMSENNDYQAYYYKPVIAKYHRVGKEAADYIGSIQGE